MMAHEAVSAAAPDANAPSPPPSSSSSGVNVFRVPHSRLNIFPMKIKKRLIILDFFFRMKELVDARLRQVDRIKQFSKQDRVALDTLLQVRK